MKIIRTSFSSFGNGIFRQTKPFVWCKKEMRKDLNRCLKRCSGDMKPWPFGNSTAWLYMGTLEDAQNKQLLSPKAITINSARNGMDRKWSIPVYVRVAHSCLAPRSGPRSRSADSAADWSGWLEAEFSWVINTRCVLARHALCGRKGEWDEDGRKVNIKKETEEDENPLYFLSIISFLSFDLPFIPTASLMTVTLAQ